jgi:ADP-ribose pyrophosphatase
MKTVYKGPVFSIESGILREPGGVRARRDIIRHSGSVAVLPVHEDGRVMLIRQYRCAYDKMVIELPAGRIDRGETPLRAAKRELREEVGFGARKWERLVRILPSPGFFASASEPDPDERIEVRDLSLPAALDLVARGKIEDGKTVVALLLEKQRRA